MSDETKITTEKRGHLLLIGLDRAKKMNAFDVAMLRQLSAALAQLEEDPALRCGVIFARGEHFTAGLDLTDVGPWMAAGKPLFEPGTIDPWGILGRRCSKPTVIGVQGRCFTLGIELCLASDIRVAATDTRFAQMEVRRGIMPFGGATFRFVQAAGWGNAMRWLLTGEEFGAEEALRIGLVQEVVAPDQVMDRAIRLAESVAAQAPLAVQATLAAARGAQCEEAAAALVPEVMRLMKTEDAREGMLSFVERREARFQGR